MTMQYRNILLSMNDHEQRQRLADFAARLASAHGARLTGLCVLPALRLYPVVTMHVPADIFEAQRKTFRERARQAEAAFRAACEEAGVEHEWRLVESASPLIADAVIATARAFDLVIAPPPADGDSVEADFADRLILESGRPVLLSPRVGALPRRLSRAVVGYNATRESARAAHDALPLLAGMEQVEVAWVDAPEDEPPPALDDMVQALRHHGVRAQSALFSSAGRDAGAVLLSHAVEQGAQLLVMGAWGHARLREYILGGATRAVMSTLSLPVLFSH